MKTVSRRYVRILVIGTTLATGLTLIQPTTEARILCGETSPRASFPQTILDREPVGPRSSASLEDQCEETERTNNGHVGNSDLSAYPNSVIEMLRQFSGL